MNNDPYHPPHPHHVHVPHGEVPRPPAHSVHPDVINYERQKQEEVTSLALEKPLLALFIVMLYFLPSAYLSYSLTKAIGWWIIIPPVIVCLIMVMGVVFIANLFIGALFGLIARALFPEASNNILKLVDAIVETILPYAIYWGIGIGYIAYIAVSTLNLFNS